MTRSFWQRRHQAAERAADIAIVGGGVIGCATAFWLHRLRPQLRLILLEAGALADGASGRNAGFILPGASADFLKDCNRYGEERARRLWQFTRENRALLVRELDPTAFDWEDGGALIVAGSAEEEKRLQEAVSWLRSDGAPAIFLSAAEINRRLQARGYRGGLYLPEGGCLDPVALVRYLAARSEALVLTHHPVLALEPCGEGVRLETPYGSVRAGQVLLALNAYLPRLLPETAAYVRPVRAQMLATEPAGRRWVPCPVYSHEGFFYLRQLADGTLLLGGARHLHLEEEVGYEDATTEALQTDLERYLHAYFPQTEGLRVRCRWSGTMGFSPDGLPVVDQVPGLAGSYWAAGFTGHGMGYGFRMGRLLAELLLGRRSEGYDLFARSDRPAFASEPLV
ncbi:FAD dependent oxidoreductase [Rhodothermus marinus SG0.5JP17-172]|uniref:NAD(P)/FAD-dependent oxidoreductase n=1 Tax=Rhodothermus marinus TaxID=29549 RepID=UPI000223D85E|nr:FAD-binding oxidoreductase [Rhodothermus marinus]AEN73400.1 FAD dependent oxidoreductase [Rhodothermus marinus SG0.5JP17-172]